METTIRPEKKILKQKKQNPQAPKPKVVKKQPQKSPNLLKPTSVPKIPIIEKHHPKISLGAKLMIIFAQALFVVALGYNSKIVNDISKLQFEVRNLEGTILEEKADMDIIEETIVKTEKLKQLEDKRVELNKKVEGAINQIPSKIEVIRTLTRDDTFELVVETDTALEASVLMFLYLNNDVAEEIALKDANLSTSTGKFTTSLEIRFK